MALFAILIILTIIILLVREWFNITKDEKLKADAEASLIELEAAKEMLEKLDREEDVLMLRDKIADKEIKLNKILKQIGVKYENK